MKKKGQPKTGGRTSGTPNKVTTDLRQWVNDLLNKNQLQFEKDLKKLEPQQRVLIIEKMLSYALPKMQSVEAKIDLNQISDEQLNVIINELTNSLSDE